MCWLPFGDVILNMATLRIPVARILILILVNQLTPTKSKVLELSDRFLDVSKQGLWLVKFYAPWCGHCKKLEPIWNQVAQTLYYSSIRVGRVDCTRFSSVATAFDVHGFPTILFLKGDKTYTYKGDRNRDDIVDFALRLEGLPVQKLRNGGELEQIKNRHEVFFLIVTNTAEDTSELWQAYNQVAEYYQESNYFYSTHAEAGLQDLQDEDLPRIHVFKDERRLNFQYPLDNATELNITLAQWVSRERFPGFVKVTHGSLPLLLRTEKYLAIAVLEENLVGRFTSEMESFRDMLKGIARQHQEEFVGDFVFGWMPHPSIANSIAMQRLDVPSLLVVNSVTYHYFLPNDDPLKLTPESIVGFLREVRDQSARAYGGNGFFTRLYRMLYDAVTTLSEMWYGNPVLTTVLFGLPLGFLFLILYSICCADILDATEDDEGARDDDSSHEKKE